MLRIMLGSMLDLIQNTHNYVHYFANSNSSSVQVRGLQCFLYVCVYIVLTNACSDGVVNIVAMLSLFNRSL